MNSNKEKKNLTRYSFTAPSICTKCLNKCHENALTDIDQQVKH